MNDISFPVFIEAYNKEQGWITTPEQFRLAEFLEHEQSQYRLIMADRWNPHVWGKPGDNNVYKTTTVCLYVAWQLRRDPMQCFTMCGSVVPLATRNTLFIRNTIEQFHLCQGMKPEKPELWQQQMFAIERPGPWFGPSVQAHSVQSSPTGILSHTLIADDVEVRDNSNTQDKREELWESIGIFPAMSQNVLFIGTRQAPENSIYDRLPEQYGARLKVFELERIAS